MHSVTWTATAFRQVYDRHIPDWRLDSSSLRYALGIPLEEVRQAHQVAKLELIEWGRLGSGLALSHSCSKLHPMARPLRIEFPSVLYHVMSDGNGRMAICLGHWHGEVFLNPDTLDASTGYP